MRTKNIRSLESHRREFFNPLFKAIVGQLDKVMLERGVDGEEILKNLYVDKRTNIKAVNEGLFHLWVNHVKQISSSGDFTGALNSSPGFVYLLLGKKGSGKTITLKYFMSQLEKVKINEPSRENSLNIIYTNLMTKQSNKKFKNDITTSLMEEIYYTIKKDNTQLFSYLCKPDKIKEVHPEYQYYNDEKTSETVFNNKSRALENTFLYLFNSGISIYLIIDNVDDLPSTSIKAIIDQCTYLMQNSHVKCIIALRDYWSPKNLNIEDKNICSHYLNKPNVIDIINKRLDAVDINSIEHKEDVIVNKQKVATANSKDIIETYKRIVNTIENNPDIQEKLCELTNYDIREYLFNIYHFFHSPYLYSKHVFVKELFETIKQNYYDFKTDIIPRKLQFFDFIENAMAVHTLCYDTASSRIFNIFYHAYHYRDIEKNNYRNTLIFIRILQQFPNEQDVRKTEIIDELICVGYDENALKDAISILLKKALIESVQGIEESEAETLFISKKGARYLELINEYSYLLFVCDDVPIPDKYKKFVIEEKFGRGNDILDRGDLRKKNESVKLFMDFIDDEERTEMEKCSNEHKNLLIRIRGEGEDSIVARMRECVEYTITNKLTSSYPKLGSQMPKIEFKAVGSTKESNISKEGR
jgi:Cdc6-like AAA superfamily ATPase